LSELKCTDSIVMLTGSSNFYPLTRRQVCETFSFLLLSCISDSFRREKAFVVPIMRTGEERPALATVKKLFLDLEFYVEFA